MSSLSPCSTLFPYTTLFRSDRGPPLQREDIADANHLVVGRDSQRARFLAIRALPAKDDGAHLRSEEHTSELQSRLHLVCRLLLEKKNINVSLAVTFDITIIR